MMSGIDFENNQTDLNPFNEDEVMEFPLWRPLVTVSITLFVGLVVPVTLFMNLSVFTALLKTDSIKKPFLVFYGSLLIGVCIEKLLVTLFIVVNSPVTIRYCLCLNLLIPFLSSPRAFCTVYFVVIVACQSVIQLLIIKGKTKWKTSYKRSLACVLLSAILALFWTGLFVTSGIVTGTPAHCELLCSDPNNSTSSDIFDFEFIAVASYLILTVAPAFVITVVASVWALVLFKRQIKLKTNTGDTSLNRKLILLPLLMVILLVCNSLIGYIVTIITGEILNSTNRGPFAGNWAYFVADIEYFIIDFTQGLVYPLVLVYLNNSLRATWKRIFCKTPNNAKMNKVLTTSSSSQSESTIHKKSTM